MERTPRGLPRRATPCNHMRWSNITSTGGTIGFAEDLRPFHRVIREKQTLNPLPHNKLFEL
ncbi:hypothetical protein GCM10007921_42440 [Tritonibacter mobilis]|nr:hypothetical protein GCM10007921_42440 [Tritonibacter mobilis]